MPTLMTLGRVVADEIYDGSITEANGVRTSYKRALRETRLGSSAINILKGARVFSQTMRLILSAELVLDKNAGEGLRLIEDIHIGYDGALITQSKEASVTVAEWVVDGNKKIRHKIHPVAPSAHFLQGLQSSASDIGHDSALALCAEYTTDYWELFEPVITKYKANGTRLWSVPSPRPRADGHGPAYKEKLAKQLDISELVVLADSDLSVLYGKPKCLRDNLNRFVADFPSYKGLVVVTAGARKPLLMDAQNKTFVYGAVPKGGVCETAVIGTGDRFTGALFAQLLQKTKPSEPLSLTTLRGCVPVAHCIALGQPFRPRKTEAQKGRASKPAEALVS